MSLSVQVRPWAEQSVMPVCDSASSDEDGSDSGCHIEDDLEDTRVVADVMERVLATVEERVDSAQRRLAELEPRDIDCERSRARKSRHRKADNPKKAVRSDEKRKSRRRSTSCSTTSSACSADYPRKHRRKHKHHKRSREGPAHSPRVNPIFLWVKQDDTRIVEVLCEDYDKRNRIRLTKTAQGWRAIPRTERLASALSARSLDAPLLSPVKKEETVTETSCMETKEEEVEAKTLTSVETENCDIDNNKVECKPLNVETECKIEPDCTVESSVNNEDRLETEPSAIVKCDEKCHADLIEEIEDNNKLIEDIEDIYTFVPTPKTDIEEIIQERLREEETLDDDIFANDVEECTEEDIEMEEDLTLCDSKENRLSPAPVDLVLADKNNSKPEEKAKQSSLNEIWRIPEETTVRQTTMPVNLCIPEARPAHQQSKTKFLESILSGPPQVCHEEKSKVFDQEEPLDLGMSRKSASPTVSSSDAKKVSENLEPIAKKMKIEDITLKTILSKTKDAKVKPNKSKDSKEELSTVDSTTKSRLLELLTTESSFDECKSDPLSQLKEVLSDPELVVPDPLLVPRARLSALVANPAKEIPRLLSQKYETYSYPKLLTDPDLLVVSLAHLQTLLQSTGKEEDALRYQHANYLKQQVKQEQSTMDAATANALNQMLWLPYLSQLEAAALACGNNQEFLAMLNMVFPSSGYSQFPYMAPTSPAMNGYDYKNQMEFHQALSMWQEAMLHAAGTGSPVGLNNNIPKPQETKFNPKQFHQSRPEPIKQTSARTSPIAMNYQQQRHRLTNHHPHPYAGLDGFVNRHSSPQGTSYRSSHHAYQRPRSYDYSSYRPSSVQPHLPTLKTEPMRPPSIGSTQDLHKSLHKHTSNAHLLTLPRQHSSHHSVKSVNKPVQSPVDLYKYVNIPNPKPVDTHHKTSTSLPTLDKVPGNPVDLSGKKDIEVPKLKVKQHLIDPNTRPKLLKFEDHPEVGSTTGSLSTPGVDETHPHLWHPLFSSQQQKSYSSPWQWTTPVAVNGE